MNEEVRDQSAADHPIRNHRGAVRVLVAFAQDLFDPLAFALADRVASVPAKKIAAAGDDVLVMGEFRNEADTELAW